MAETPTTPRDVTSRRGRLKRWLLPSGWRARLRRSGQLVLLLLLVLVVVLAAALFVGLGTRNGRQALLQVALRSADSALPGELSVAAPRWPRPQQRLRFSSPPRPHHPVEPLPALLGHR